MGSIVEWNRLAKQLNQKTRLYYQLAYFARNLRARMYKNFNENLNPEGFDIILYAWKEKLDGLRELLCPFTEKITFKRHFKKAEAEIKFWERLIMRAQKEPEILTRTDWLKYGEIKQKRKAAKSKNKPRA